MKPLPQKILENLIGRNYLSEMDLVTKTGGEISAVMSDVSDLIASGNLTQVGVKYNAHYNKLFRLVTNKTDRAEELRSKANGAQFRQQRSALVKQLVDELREHKNRSSIKEGLN